MSELFSSSPTVVDLRIISKESARRPKIKGPVMNTSLYLSQSYKDAWSDYLRSLSSSIPTWDYVVLTASNEHQAKSFQAQIDARRPFCGW